MRRRAERPEAELAKARLIIQIQGKASELLEAAGRERRPHAAAVIESSFAESEPATGTKGACLAWVDRGRACTDISEGRSQLACSRR